MKSIAIISAASLVLAGAAWAQMEAPKPGPEVKKLEVFVGSWTREIDIKPNSIVPPVPAGTATETAKCDWMEGNFFILCHSDYKGASIGEGSALSIWGYSAGDKTYTYREYNSWGETMESKGTLDGDTWIWTSEEKMGEKVTKDRFTIKITSPTSYTFISEISTDGAKWTTFADGSASKAK